MSISSYKPIAVVDKNHVSISTSIPSCRHNPSCISCNNSRTTSVRYIESWVIPNKPLSNCSLCWPNELTRSNNSSCIRCCLSYTRSYCCCWHHSIRNNDSLTNG